MTTCKRIYIAGHNGMVGSSLRRRLDLQKDLEIVVRERDELDLLSQADVSHFFRTENIDEVYLAAAKVGGILANNDFPADFIYENLMIESNIIHSAHKSNVQKLLFLGSSCIYPKLASQPISESALLSGYLEPTNEPYAIAKIAGIKLCESYNRQYKRDYRCVMPTNLYGENDNFHPKNSHVVPALISRFHKAKVNNENSISVWGSGKPMREFLYIDDMAEASIFVMELEKSVYQFSNRLVSHVNIGTGIDCSIRELAETIAKVVGFRGDILFDLSKPDGTPRKLLDVSLLKDMGWNHKIDLYDGLNRTYKWFLQNQDRIRT